MYTRGSIADGHRIFTWLMLWFLLESLQDPCLLCLPNMLTVACIVPLDRGQLLEFCALFWSSRQGASISDGLLSDMCPRPHVSLGSSRVLTKAIYHFFVDFGVHQKSILVMVLAIVTAASRTPMKVLYIMGYFHSSLGYFGVLWPLIFGTLLQKLRWKCRGAPCKTTILHVGPSMSFHVNLREGKLAFQGFSLQVGSLP